MFNCGLAACARPTDRQDRTYPSLGKKRNGNQNDQEPVLME